VRDLMSNSGEGKTVFFSTHILSDAEALCDRVAVIHLENCGPVGAVADLNFGSIADGSSWYGKEPRFRLR